MFPVESADHKKGKVHKLLHSNMYLKPLCESVRYKIPSEVCAVKKENPCNVFHVSELHCQMDRANALLMAYTRGRYPFKDLYKTKHETEKTSYLLSPGRENNLQTTCIKN